MTFLSRISTKASHMLAAAGVALAMSPTLAEAEDRVSAVHAFPDFLVYTQTFLAMVDDINERGKGVVQIDVRGGPEAIGMFQQAVKDPKHKVSSRKQIGECFVHKELYDMAKSQFVAALQEVGDKESNLWKEINYLLARACEANEEVDEALDHYQEIMAVDIAYEDVSTRVSALRKK